jgi:hypothetical protein
LGFAGEGRPEGVCALTARLTYYNRRRYNHLPGSSNEHNFYVSSTREDTTGESQTLHVLGNTALHHIWFVCYCDDIPCIGPIFSLHQASEGVGGELISYPFGSRWSSDVGTLSCCVQFKSNVLVVNWLVIRLRVLARTALRSMQLGCFFDNILH